MADKESVHYDQKDIKIYVQEDNIKWIDTYPMGGSRCGSVSTAADWAITQIKRGAKTAFLALNLMEIMQGRMEG